jgi:hypothetical protein
MATAHGVTVVTIPAVKEKPKGNRSPILSTKDSIIHALYDGYALIINQRQDKCQQRALAVALKARV